MTNAEAIAKSANGTSESARRSFRCRGRDDKRDDPDSDQEVADREDVGEREAARKREDVSQEGQMLVTELDIRASGGTQACGGPRVLRSRHTSAVCRDCDRVQAHPHEQREERQITHIRDSEEHEQRVARNVEAVDSQIG